MRRRLLKTTPAWSWWCDRWGSGCGRGRSGRCEVFSSSQLLLRSVAAGGAEDGLTHTCLYPLAVEGDSAVHVMQLLKLIFSSKYTSMGVSRKVTLVQRIKSVKHCISYCTFPQLFSVTTPIRIL